MSRVLILLGGIACVAVILIAVLARFNAGVNQSVKKVIPIELGDFETSSPREIPPEPPLTRAELADIIEASLSAVNKKIADLEKKQQTLPVSSQITPTTAPTTATSTSSGPKVSYVPIGYTGSGTYSSDFGTVSGYETAIDPGNYPGYKKMVLEVNFRIFQNGTAEVRLFNKTDGVAITNSDISTTSQSYTTVTSSGFTLASGSKTYTIQVKSSTGYAVELQWARLRVDF